MKKGPERAGDGFERCIFPRPDATKYRCQPLRWRKAPIGTRRSSRLPRAAASQARRTVVSVLERRGWKLRVKAWRSSDFSKQGQAGGGAKGGVSRPQKHRMQNSEYRRARIMVPRSHDSLADDYATDGCAELSRFGGLAESS